MSFGLINERFDFIESRKLRAGLIIQLIDRCGADSGVSRLLNAAQ